MLGMITAALAAPPIGLVPTPDQAHVQLTQAVLPTRTIASFTTLEGGAPLYRTSNEVFGVGLSAQASALGLVLPSEDRGWFGPQSGAVGAWVLLRSSKTTHGFGLIGHLGARATRLYAVVAHPRSTGVTLGYRLSARLGERVELGLDVDTGINGWVLIHAAASPWGTIDLGTVAFHARLTGAYIQELSAVSGGASLQLGRVDLSAMVHGVGAVWPGGAPFHVVPQITLRYQVP